MSALRASAMRTWRQRAYEEDLSVVASSAFSFILNTPDAIGRAGRKITRNYTRTPGSAIRLPFFFLFASRARRRPVAPRAAPGNISAHIGARRLRNATVMPLRPHMVSGTDETIAKTCSEVR